MCRPVDFVHIIFIIISVLSQRMMMVVFVLLRFGLRLVAWEHFLSLSSSLVPVPSLVFMLFPGVRHSESIQLLPLVPMLSGYYYDYAMSLS